MNQRYSMRTLCLSGLLITLLLGADRAALASSPPPAGAVSRGHYAQNASDVCRLHTEYHEVRLRLPQNILTALSHVESGRWDTARQEKIAWPWTVMAEGNGRYFRTKAEAIREVRTLQSRGVRNIDVGCMQINLKHHPNAFRTLEDAFDPARNVAYAADFLTRLHSETGSWAKAATRYHSATPVRATRYGGLLTRAWSKLNNQSRANTRQWHKETRRHLALPSPVKRMIYPYPQMKAIGLRNTKTESIHARERYSRRNANDFAENWRSHRLTEYLGSRRASATLGSNAGAPPAPDVDEKRETAPPDASISAPVAFGRIEIAER